LKDQNSINEKILAAEQELAALAAKRTALQDRIRQLQGLKQSIADEQLPFNQRSESNITNESTEKQKIALFRSLFRGRSGPAKEVTSRFAAMSGSGLYVINPKSNAVIVKTGILRHFRTMSFETT
jgi:hypothetical protein